jgi:hypothetical protein
MCALSQDRARLTFDAPAARVLLGLRLSTPRKGAEEGAFLDEPNRPQEEPR